MAGLMTKIIPAVIGSVAGKAGAGKGLLGAGLGMVAARIATRSVPGALLVGGVLAAKWLYDQKEDAAAAPDATPKKASTAAPKDA